MRLSLYLHKLLAMKRFLSLCSVWAFMLLLILQSCTKPYLTVTPSSLAFSADGGAQTIQVSSNKPWTASVNGSGFSVSPLSGTGDASVTVTASATTLTDPSEGSVVFTGEGLSVTVSLKQDPKLVIIVGTPGEPTNVPANGGQVVIPVEYNANYDVTLEESAQSWIRVVRTKSLSTGSIELYVSENTGDERTASLTVTEKSGIIDPIVVTIVQQKSQEVEIRRILMALYNALDGPNWKMKDGWGTDKPVNKWAGVDYAPSSNDLYLSFNGNGLKGEIPEIIGDFEGLLTSLSLNNEPGVTGKLPDSFRKLVNLKYLTIHGTSMTSLPDVFADMKSLTNVSVANNEQMTGPLPESIGSSPVMESLGLTSNMFTGGIPDSWDGLCGKFFVGMNCLTGKLPASILTTGENVWLLGEILPQREGYGFDISEAEIHGGKFWPKGMVEDLAGGASFSFEDIISKNKCTIFLNWSLEDFYSKRLINELKELYDLYHQDGLDIIATVMGNENDIRAEDQKNVIMERGCNRWHNYYYPAYNPGSYLMTTPCVEAYDSNGNIVFSSFFSFPDPVRKRFGKIAVSDLPPFLLDMFELVPYTSTDYSKDGEVKILQRATVGNGINIVFMGDAFTDRDMGDGGFYDTIMQQSMEEFFAIEPYKTFRNRFNVYQVKVVSPNGRLGEKYTTALETVAETGSTTIVGNSDKAEVYSLKVPSISTTDNLLTCVMVRDQRYAGTCLMSRNKQSAVAYTSTETYDRELFGRTLRHEAGGHGFGFLSDEYWYYNEYIPDSKKEEYQYLNEQFGWYSNVDFTGDPSKVHWSAFLSDDRYKDEVGIFEGGALYHFGVWCPSENSMMNENVEYFNAPSRWAIYKRIMELSGETASFEKFLEYDAVNRGTRSAARPPLRSAANNVVRHTAPPIIVP